MTRTEFNIFRKDEIYIALEAHRDDYIEIETLEEQCFVL